MRCPNPSTVRTTLHGLLLIVLLSTIHLLTTPLAAAIGATANDDGGARTPSSILLGSQASVGPYVSAKMVLLGLLLVRLPDLLGDGGGDRTTKGELGLHELEKWATLTGAALWVAQHVCLLKLLHPFNGAHPLSARDGWVLHASGATTAILLALAFLHVCQIQAPSPAPSVPDKDAKLTLAAADRSGEKASVPLIVVTSAEEGPHATAPTRGKGDDAERVPDRGALVESPVVLGVLLGATLSVGISAIVVTSVLGYQPATPLLLPVALSIPLFLSPSVLSTAQLSATMSAVLLLWYPATLAFSVDRAGAPTCGIWDPYASALVRRLEPLLCHLSMVIYYLGWFVAAGLLLLLVDLHFRLADADLDAAAGEDDDEDDLPLGEELRLLARVLWDALLAPARRLRPTTMKVCNGRRRGPIHLA